jgi:hypothetical protein
MRALATNHAGSRTPRVVASVLLALFAAAMLMVVDHRSTMLHGKVRVLEALIAIATLGGIATILLDQRRRTPLLAGVIIVALVSLLVCYVSFVR